MEVLGINIRQLVTVIILSILLVVCIGFTSSAQTTKPVKAQPVSVKDTTINGVTHKLYIGSKGGRYIIRVSKAGNEYKQYFSTKK